MNSMLESTTEMPKKKVSKNYFTQETEDAIVLIQQHLRFWSKK
jgi:hypothetical protein